ncbi:MAG: hypothetical protein ACM3SY_14380 [Candidatus Omnitrophota bacterium]
MEIKEELKETQQKLSKVNTSFFEFVERHPVAFQASTFRTLDLNSKLFVLQPWPTFINKTAVDEFREASVKVFELIKSIPQRIFGNNVEKISAYYGLPLQVVKLHLEGATERHIRDLVGRGDFLLGPSGLKCLEFNITANLGGWYVPVWETLYLNHPLVGKFLREYQVKTHNSNLIHQFLEHILEAILLESENLHSPERNTVFVVKNYMSEAADLGVYLNAYYQTLLKKKDRHLTGEVMVCDYHHMKTIDKHLYYKGKRIHALVEFYNGLVPPEVQDVFRAGNVRLWNGPITDLLSSKLNLALLSDYHAAGSCFSDEEKRIIDRFIPWSRKVTRGSSTYGTEIIDLEHFILSQKDRLVIKSSVGYGGKSVFVGQKLSATEWEGVLRKALEGGNWMVQEFVEALSAVYQSGENGYEPHDMVWGIFVLGSQYGGTWVRVMPQKDNKGTINCHQGARVSVIFEVDE